MVGFKEDGVVLTELVTALVVLMQKRSVSHSSNEGQKAKGDLSYVLTEDEAALWTLLEKSALPNVPHRR